MIPLLHPGPKATSRFAAIPCRADPLGLTLQAGRSLADAVVQAFAAAGFDAGYLRIAGAQLSRADYVIPAPAQGDGRAAWYSRTHTITNAQIVDAGVHLGVKDGAPFLHCHAIFQDADGHMRLGHLLCPQSILAADVQVDGWSISGAHYVMKHDAETGFDLFQPEPSANDGGSNAFLCTLRPNEDIHALIGQITDRPMQVEGIGSLVGTLFENSTLTSYATEILLRRGDMAGCVVTLEAASVGFDGVMQQGQLQVGANNICITAEVLLTESGSKAQLEKEVYTGNLEHANKIDCAISIAANACKGEAVGKAAKARKD
jgi:hypothetical protein